VYQWDFGDSTVQSFYDTLAVHRYPAEGDYRVRLTVYEGAFAFASDSTVVAIRER
jgi:PKD repeat protein